MYWITIWILHWMGETQCVSVTGVSSNQGWYEHHAVKKSLAAVAIFRGQYQESPYAFQRLSGLLGDIIFWLWVNNSQDLQFSRRLLRLALMAVVSGVTTSLLNEFVQLIQLLLKSLHAMMCHCGNCTHYTAGLIIVTQLSQLWIFFITLLIFRIPLIISTCNVAQTISNCILHLLKYFFGFSIFQSCHFSILHIILLQFNHFLHVFDLPFRHHSFGIHIILNPFTFPLVG